MVDNSDPNLNKSDKSDKYIIDFEPLRQAFIDTSYDIDKLPILDIGQLRGSTDYIDFIKESDMSHTVMRGLDIFGRPFVSIKFNIRPDPNSSDNSVQNIKPCQAVGTFFQRYSDNTELWAYGTLNHSNMSLHYESRIRDNQYSNLISRLNMFLNNHTMHNICNITSDEPDFIVGAGHFNISLI